MPLVKVGEWVAVLAVQSVTPRHWTSEDIALVEETAERTWEAAERARAEASLRASEARLQRMANVEGVGVLTFDAASGILLDANDAFLNLTGYTRVQLDARALTWRTMTPHEYIAESEAQMASLAEAGRVGPYEKEYLRADGSRSWMLFAGSALGDGTVVEYCIDVSERKRAEAALAAAAEQARLHAARDALRRELAAAEERERRRLAREVHDQLGQQLTGLALGLEYARRVAATAGFSDADRELLARRLDQLQALAGEMTMGARYIALELRPPELDDLGFENAIETYAGEWSARFGIAVDFLVTGECDPGAFDEGSAAHRGG